MEMYDMLFSSSGMLNDQIARQLFGQLPEDGPVMVIRDSKGNSWPSNSDEIAKLALCDSIVADVCERVADGAEPVVRETETCCVVAGQLCTDNTACGYVVLAFGGMQAESLIKNWAVVEMLLNQCNLVARLVEQNNRLYEMQQKYQSHMSSK